MAIELRPIGAGSGDDSVTLSFTDTDGDPIVMGDPFAAESTLCIATDESGRRAVAGPIPLNSVGRVQVYLDAGRRYFLWLQAPGYAPLSAVPFIAVAG